MRPFRGPLRRLGDGLRRVVGGPYSWVAERFPGGRLALDIVLAVILLAAIAFVARLVSSRGGGVWSAPVRSVGALRARVTQLHSSRRPTPPSNGVTSSWPCGSVFAPASCASNVRDRFRAGNARAASCGVRSGPPSSIGSRAGSTRSSTGAAHRHGGCQGGAERLAHRPRQGRGAMTIRTKSFLAIGGVLVGVNVVIAITNGLVGGTPGGPVSSSYATGSDGLAAYASLLGRSGHQVSRLRTPLAEAQLDPRDTVVLLDADGVTRDDAGALRAFVQDGGRLVVGGNDPIPMA